MAALTPSSLYRPTLHYPKRRCSLSRVVFATAMAVALASTRVLAMLPSRFPTDMSVDVARSGIPERNFEQFCVPLHVFREKTVPPELLQLKTNSSKPVALFATAKQDHNGALDPGSKVPLMLSLSKEYNFKYVVIESLDELGREIDKGAEYGPVKLVIFHSHMTPTHFYLSEDNNVTFASDFRRCFQNASPDARVVMLGCRSGEPGGERQYSLARWISATARRLVFAATSIIYGDQIQFLRENPAWVGFSDGAEDVGVAYVPGKGALPNSLEETERERDRRLCQEHEWRVEVAAEEGDLGQVQALLRAAPAFITRTARGKGMVGAAEQGHTHVVEALLANGPTHARHRAEAVAAAARGRHWHIADILLQSGPLPYHGRSEALVQAAKQGHLDLVKKLLANGSISQFCLEKAVLAAVETGNVHIVKALLAKGDISIATRGEAARLAIPLLQVEILECLLINGPIHPRAQVEAIHLANWAANRVQMLYLLLRHFPISVEVRSDAVMRAVCLGHRAAVEALLESGPIFESTRREAITQAWCSGREDIADLLS